MKIIKKNFDFSYKKPPLIIAEISGNHNGSKSRFLRLVEEACKSRADLIKIQTYEPEDMTLNIKNSKFKINKGIWKGKNLYALYKRACTPYKWHLPAFKIAKRYKKVIFSSPFSIRAVDFLEKFKVPIYKIASFEITDYKLIKYIASKKKPIIISTGMATLKEIKNAINIIKKYHKKIIILHCVSNYPTKMEDMELNRINFLKREFKNFKIGLSDHTNDIFTSIASVPFGVCAIEKHFNMDNTKTPDSSFSINSDKINDLKKITEQIFLSVNRKINKKNLSKNIKFRRSIFAKKNIFKGEKISHENIVSLRPLIGLGSENFFKIIGKKIKKNIKKNSSIFLNDLKE